MSHKLFTSFGGRLPCQSSITPFRLQAQPVNSGNPVIKSKPESSHFDILQARMSQGPETESTALDTSITPSEKYEQIQDDQALNRTEFITLDRLERGR